MRSWCGWCWRVVPGIKDLEAAAKEEEEKGKEKRKGKTLVSS